MGFDEVVRRRKMIREYEFDRSIPDYIIAKLIDNAHRAPAPPSGPRGPGP